MRALVLLLAFLTVVRPVAWGQTFETLFSNDLGSRPLANLIQGSNGNFYGTTYEGGVNNNGTVFKMTPEGEFTTLVSFDYSNGSQPMGGVVEGDDGNFYGTTSRGAYHGTVFRIAPSGALTTLVFFDGGNGKNPLGDLLKGKDGNFYGTTAGGGASDLGTIFKLTPDGKLTTLISFNGANGRWPHGGLVQGSDGNFYGMTSAGGPLGYGTIFKMTPTGELTTLVSFAYYYSATLRPGKLLEGSDGNFYGTAKVNSQDSQDRGIVFKMTPAGVFTTLASFTGTNGSSPASGVVQGADGHFYGMTESGGSYGGGTVYRMTPEGELTTLGSLNDISGTAPNAGLVVGSDGNFYGTTSKGGTYGGGTVFRMTPDGMLTPLASVGARNGHHPRAGLVEGSDGNFYGTTNEGGANNLGTVFKITPGGAITTLASFNGANGSGPRAGLVEGINGIFYGTTQYGGANGSSGTVYKVTADGELTTLVSFTGPNGIRPSSGLVRGADGNFYGTTEYGGAGGRGTIFKVTPTGALTTLVFFDGVNGSYPVAKLSVGTDGSFYGITPSGSDYRGTIFKVTSDGALTTLVDGLIISGGLLRGSDGNFYGTLWDRDYRLFKMTPSGVLTTVGFIPVGAELVEGSDGNFYGATRYGGARQSGEIFRMTPSGVRTTLYSFDGKIAADPEGAPIFGSDGKLYGTAAYMTVWRLSLPVLPSATVSQPGGITTTGVILSGYVNGRGKEATVTFEYGLTPAYGRSIAVVPGTITGSSETAVSAMLLGLTPHTTYYYRLTASNSEGSTSTAGASFTTANSLPAAGNDSFHPDRMNSSGSITLPVLDNDSDADGDTLTITAVTQGSSGTVTINGNILTYTPGPGFVGRDSFAYTISDGIATASAQVEIRATEIITRALLSQNSEVPGAGREGSEIPEGSFFKSFGVPSINSSGTLVLTGSYAVLGSASELSVLMIEPRTAWTKLAARKGQTAPGTRDARFASFKDPLLNEAGDVAFLASLSGGDAKKGQRNGIWINTASSAGSQGTQLLARTGAQPPGAPEGARWQSFTSVAFSSGSNEASEAASGWFLAFTGFMTIGLGDVKSSDDMGLWIASSDKTVLALREGQKLQFGTTEKKVRTFAALKPHSNAPGQGNGINGNGGVAVQVFFTDGSQGMLQMKWSGVDDLPSVIPVLAYSGAAVADLSEAAGKLGIPTQSGSGGRTAWAGSLTSKVDAAGIFERNLNEAELHLLARHGNENTGIEGASFSAFTSVAVNDSGDALLHGKVHGRGVTKANDEGLWWKKWTGEGFILQLLAREGAQSPDVPEGATWRSFTSLALPEGQQYGPLFTARLVAGPRSKPAPRSLTSDNDQGLWAVDSSGELRLIVREGQQIPVEDSASAKSIKSFTVLSAVPGAPTQRRSFADDGQIVYRVLFTDGSQAVMKVQLP